MTLRQLVTITSYRTMTKYDRKELRWRLFGIVLWAFMWLVAFATMNMTY